MADISQAYDILSDPEKRKIYDAYGLEFLLRGGTVPPSPGAGGPGGFPGGFGRSDTFPGSFNTGGGGGTPRFTFSTSTSGNGFNFMPRNAEDIFSQFARTGGFEGETGIPGLESIFGGSSPLGAGGRSSSFNNGGASRFGARANGTRKPAAEATVLEKHILFTLEE